MEHDGENNSENTLFSTDLADIPTLPGIYIYKDAKARIIYVGKAKHLRKRVASYFRNTKDLTPKTRAMLAQATSIDTLCTDTEKEALLLEASLIKKHKPRYNIVLRDDKQYILFKLDKSTDYPRLSLTRRVIRDGALYYGPFTSAYAAREAWKAIHKVFPLRRCSDKAFKNRVRPCLYHHIKLCLAPCVLEVPKEEYKKLVQRVEMLLSGRSGKLMDALRKEMLVASEALDFEKAAILRDRMKAVEQTLEQQATVLPEKEDMDVLGLAQTDEGLALGVLFVRRGRVLDKRNFFWPGLSLEEGGEVMEGFLAQYYGPQQYIPKKILLPWHFSSEPDMYESVTNEDEAAQSNGTSFYDTFTQLLTERRGGAVRIVAPKTRIEKQLIVMAGANAREDARGAGKDAMHPALAGIASKLHLPTRPEPGGKPFRIESVDVSHTQGKDTKAGMVVFENGEPKKSDYRTYAFNDPALKGDDYGVLAAWAKRRLNSGPPWPDLLLVDGGKGQLAVVERALKQAIADAEDEAPKDTKVELWPLAAIAKTRIQEDAGSARRRQTHALDDRIFLPGRKNPVTLRPGSPELLFLQHVRDSVHNFVISRHRRARQKTALTGEVLRLPGVGPKTARLLWDNFSTLDAMIKATPEALQAIPGLGKKRASMIYEQLQKLR